jgi:hypothetical protein
MRVNSPIPSWLEWSGKGLAFWIGYNNIRYGYHHLPEGAIVAEFARLIASELGDSFAIEMEVPYAQIAAKPGQSKGFTGDRADLVVMQTNRRTRSVGIRKGLRYRVCAVLEVKLAHARKSLIDEDIVRLGKVLGQIGENKRAFLVLVAQRKLPGRYLSERESASREILTVDGFSAKVRRIYGAYRGLKRGSGGFRVCVIEVAFNRTC